MADGRGLHLLVQPSGAKWWRWTYRRPDTGKVNTLSLGTFPDVKLHKARVRREEAREQVADGIDPGEQRQEDDAAKKAAAANTFEAVARYRGARQSSWPPAILIDAVHYRDMRLATALKPQKGSKVSSIAVRFDGTS